MNCGTSATAAGCIQLQPSRETHSIWPQSPTKHLSTLCNATMRRAMPRNAVQRHVVLCSAKKCCATPCCPARCQEMPHHAMLHHVAPCSARHAMQCCRAAQNPASLSRNFPLHAHQPQPPGTHVLFLPLQVLLCPCSSSADRSTRASGPANW